MSRTVDFTGQSATYDSMLPMGEGWTGGEVARLLNIVMPFIELRQCPDRGAAEAFVALCKLTGTDLAVALDRLDEANSSLRFWTPAMDTLKAERVAFLFGGKIRPRPEGWEPPHPVGFQD